jgi:hypothetical protein
MGADRVTQGWTSSSSSRLAGLARESTDVLRWWVHLLLLLLMVRLVLGQVLGLVERDWRLGAGAVAAKCMWRHAMLQALRLLLLLGWEARGGV